jgi:tetraacyldisaccharide 4'-kinase
MSWGNPENWIEETRARMLWPASLAFGMAGSGRMLAYQKGILKRQTFDATVLSVGNITCGGTGKTPVTIDLATRLVEDGRRVAILSRGYKRRSKQQWLVVSDGKGNLSSCADSGDEPYLIAKSVPEAVVIVGSRRVITAEMAVKEFGCDVILLDDGFQHLAIARDLDVVLVDYNDDLYRDSLLPAGRLREPLTAISRATWIVITKVPEDADVQRLEKMRAQIASLSPSSTISACRMSSNSLVDPSLAGASADVSLLNGKTVVAFSAIARPAAFTSQLKTLGASVAEHRSFPDHHWYSPSDIEALRELQVRHSASVIITTEKDAVKLSPELVQDLPVLALQQNVEWLGPIPTSELITRAMIKPKATAR